MFTAGILILSSNKTTVASLPPGAPTAGTLILSSDQTTVASLPPGAPVDIRCDRTGAEKSRLLLQTGLVSALYQDVWGQPITPEALADYTFLLSTDGTLADVRADMEALHLQTVVLPTLIATSGLLQ